MFWKIRNDHQKDEYGDRTGCSRGQQDTSVKLYTAKLYDDDNVLCFTVLFDQEAWDNDDDPAGLYGCYQWAMNDVGVTDLRVRRETYAQLSPNTNPHILERITRSDGWTPVYS